MKRLIAGSLAVLLLGGCGTAPVAPAVDDEIQKVTKQLDDLNKSGGSAQATETVAAKSLPPETKRRNSNTCIGLAEVLDATNAQTHLITALKNGDWQKVVEQCDLASGDKVKCIALAVAHYNLGNYRACVDAAEAAKKAGVEVAALDELSASARSAMPPGEKTEVVVRPEPPVNTTPVVETPSDPLAGLKAGVNAANKWKQLLEESKKAGEAGNYELCEQKLSEAFKASTDDSMREFSTTLMILAPAMWKGKWDETESRLQQLLKMEATAVKPTPHIFVRLRELEKQLPEMKAKAHGGPMKDVKQ